MTFFREYRIPIIVTAALHATLLAFMLSNFSSTKPHKVTPKFIQASLVSLQDKPQAKVKPAAKPKPKPIAKPKPKPKPVEKPKPIVKPKSVEKPKPIEKPKPVVEKPKVDPEAIALKKKKAAAEEAKKIADVREKERQDKLRKEQEQLKAKRIADEKRFYEQALLEQQMMEEAEEEAFQAQQAESDEAAALSYMSAIKAAVESNWSRPPSARNGMQVTLQIDLVPTGAVVAVNVVSSSGNDAFDRSAVAAVYQTERFDELKQLESRVFERYYRRFSLLFNPGDLRL